MTTSAAMRTALTEIDTPKHLATHLRKRVKSFL
jgi:hypothetical protein